MPPTIIIEKSSSLTIRFLLIKQYSINNTKKPNDLRCAKRLKPLTTFDKIVITPIDVSNPPLDIVLGENTHNKEPIKKKAISGKAAERNLFLLKKECKTMTTKPTGKKSPHESSPKTKLTLRWQNTSTRYLYP